MKNWLLGSTSVAGTAAALVLSLGSAVAADMPLKSPAKIAACAVDGVNSKAAGLGGSFANMTVYGGLGSLSMPLGCEFGVQVDGFGGSLDGDFLGAGAAHLFWRNPNKGLLGFYGSYTYWNRVGGVRVGHVGPEAEIYMGRWTAKGVAGAEFGNSTSGTIASFIQTYTVKTRFFDQLNLSYYADDNWKLSVGHRYLGGKHALALGTEYGIAAGQGRMMSLFAEGRVGEGSFHGVWGGLRVYFGQKDKTLIRRHREDDPSDWDVGIDGTPNSGSTSSAAPPPLPPT